MSDDEFQTCSFGTEKYYLDCKKIVQLLCCVEYGTT